VRRFIHPGRNRDSYLPKTIWKMLQMPARAMEANTHKSGEETIFFHGSLKTNL
jgi:hypothetical protein